MKSDRPLLIVVTGAPGSGKTSLARLLAQRLSLRLLTKDRLKTALADMLGAHNREETQRLTGVAFRQLYALVHEQLEVGVGVILEANLYREVAEPDLTSFLDLASVMQVHCETSFETSAWRFTIRADDADRHWSFFDYQRVAELARGEVPEPWFRAQPLDLPIPLLRVDTTDGYVPRFAEIVAWIQTATARTSDVTRRAGLCARESLNPTGSRSLAGTESRSTGWALRAAPPSEYR